MALATARRTALSLLFALCFTGIAFAQDVPRSSHIWIVNEENNGYEEIVGSPQMPYYNQLIAQYGLATQFYSDQHSSLPALMWFVAGAPVEANNDTTSCDHREDNVVRALLKHGGYTWRSYQEDMPYAGYQGLYGGTDGNYYRRHNPLIDFSDVCPGTGQADNSVPYTQMASDFAAGNPVNFAWVTPDAIEDAHSASLQDADQWLQAHVPAILARPEFQKGGDGILFIVWDESELYNDNRCSATVSEGCGGRTATLVIGPNVKPGYESTVTYHNENVLATVCAAMGLHPCPGAAHKAAPMADFFTTSTGSGGQDGVVISSPGDGATITGSVHLIASAAEKQHIRQTQVWDNGKKLGVYGPQVNEIFNLAPGIHTTTVEDMDSAMQRIHETTVTYTVEQLVDGVQIVSPSPNQVIDNSLTVHIVAQATESEPIDQLQVWDNGVKLGWYAGSSVNQYFSLDPGVHTVTVEDLNDNNQVLHRSAVTYEVESSGVQILSPTASHVFDSTQVTIVAHASESVAVNQMQVWDNGTKLGWYRGADVHQTYTLDPGKHVVTVEDLNDNYEVIHRSRVTYTVK